MTIFLAALAVAAATAVTSAGPAAAVEAPQDAEVLVVSSVAYAPCPAYTKKQRVVHARVGVKVGTKATKKIGKKASRVRSTPTCMPSRSAGGR
jgi:flagellar basal body-associated protein FliL